VKRHYLHRKGLMNNTHCSTDDTFQQTIQAKTTQQVPDQVQDTREEHTNSGNDLSEGLTERVEERTEVTFRFRERVELVTGPLNGTAYFFEQL
jgi:hypothetical protein